jgi:hypothetical protein
MLATKPAGTSTRPCPGANPPYNLAAATTEMMWACALATARVTVASTARGLEVWSHMLRAPAGRLAGQDAAPPPAAAVAAVPEPAASVASVPAPAEPIPFASYRSSGGHAATHVIVSD